MVLTLRALLPIQTELEAIKNDPNIDKEPGDVYINQGDGNTYVWNGSEFINLGPLSGPEGPDGATGPEGPEGATGPEWFYWCYRS